MSLFDRLGGKPAINAAVDVFYEKMLSDDRVAKFFDSTDMVQQANKQKAFLTFVLGGPVQYSGKQMREAHAHLVEQGLNDEHFDVVVSHLGATLGELGVAEQDIQEVAELAETLRNDVLNRDPITTS